jgi:hypothetical protein
MRIKELDRTAIFDAKSGGLPNGQFETFFSMANPDALGRGV